MARKSTHSADFLASTQERRNFALAERRAGKSQAQIAQETGWSKQTVSAYIKAAIADITRESAEEYIAITEGRYDEMLAGIWKDATHGDTWKIDRALAIEDQRARLLGLYKHAELKVIADAKGNVSEESTSMVGQLTEALRAIYAAQQTASALAEGVNESDEDSEEGDSGEPVE